ncbi:hypothetical protein SUGI_0976360 [Cryptomeria japonica]|nr:hypothetical protein SUGI_0976360 [Cryptomeria japonica]
MLSDVPRSSSCSNICKARKQRCEDAIAKISLPDLEISEIQPRDAEDLGFCLTQRSWIRKKLVSIQMMVQVITKRQLGE